MRKPYAIHVHTVSESTRECIREVMRAVSAGECIGIAMAPLYRNKRYDLIICGEAARSPTFARGMVAALGDDLAKLQRGDEA